MADHDIEICDGHMHLWDLDHNVYPWLNGAERVPVEVHMAGPLNPIRKNYLLQDFLADTKPHKVVKIVHVQAEHSDHLTEAKWIQSLHDQNGMPNAQVCGIRFDEPKEKVLALLTEYSKLSTVRGVRQLLNWHETEPKFRFTDKPDHMRNPHWIANYALLEKFGYSFDLHIYPWQAGEAANLVKQFPGIPVILDHTGIDYVRTPESFQKWSAAMKTLAAVPHVYMKISGTGNFMLKPGWTPDQFAPYVLAAIQIFGIDRCFFSSNFPVDKLAGSYEHLYDSFKQIVKDFSPADKKKLFKDNVEKIYRVK